MRPLCAWLLVVALLIALAVAALLEDRRYGAFLKGACDAIGGKVEMDRDGARCMKDGTMVDVLPR